MQAVFAMLPIATSFNIAQPFFGEGKKPRCLGGNPTPTPSTRWVEALVVICVKLTAWDDRSATTVVLTNGVSLTVAF